MNSFFFEERMSVLRLLLLLFAIANMGCSKMDNKREEAEDIIKELQNNDIADFAIAHANHYPFECIDCPEEIPYFKKYVLPALTPDVNHKVANFIGSLIKIRLQTGKVIVIRMDSLHWSPFLTDNVQKDGYISGKIQSGYKVTCYKLNHYEGANSYRRIRILSTYLCLPLSTPPKLPSVLGDSMPKYEKYFQDISEGSSLNKKRLAAFFNEVAGDNPGWGEKRKNDREYFHKLGDFLLDKGDNITYDDFLKIIGAWDLPNSSAPVPTKWKP